MSSRLRTASAGVAVVAICLLLTSLNWLQLLTILFVSCVGWSIWSRLSYMERRRKKERWLKRSRMEEATRARKAEREAGIAGGNLKRPPVVRDGNVYHFPARGEAGHADSDIDEALDWPV